MSLWCVQVGRHRLRRLAGATLGALLTVAIFGCGRTAPEGFWGPTKDDTAGIKQVVEANKAYFRTGLAELAMTMCDTALPGTTGKVLQKQMIGDRFTPRFRLNQMEHVLDTHQFEYTFTANLNLDTVMEIDSAVNPPETTWVPPDAETTCTVTMAETIPGTLRMHAWAKTPYLRDSIIIVNPSDTIRLPFYDSVMKPCDTVIQKPLNGYSVEGCVLKKEGDTWRLWKLAGGGRFYAPDPNDAPTIYDVYVRSSRKDSITLDTVALRPDTLHYGIQRFYALDSAKHQLLTYSPGDWFALLAPYTNPGDAIDYFYFNGHRHAITDTVRLDSLSSGIYRLTVEHLPATVIWEAKGSYNAVVWGIPIRIR
ncbi:MAG TPA: hypothetical protein VMH22_14360 [bacterium]|nr:hypothetical protein [bacterium]